MPRPESINELLVLNADGSLNIGDTVSNFSVKSVYVPSWNQIAKQFYGNRHRIITDHSIRPQCKISKDGQKDEPARITYEAEKLTTRNAVQMSFTNPALRTYDIKGTDSEIEIKKEIRSSIEKIYSNVRIDGENINRFYAYFAACEMITIWYVKDVGYIHNEYGFPTRFKLRCQSYSPAPEEDTKISQAELYPVFDKNDNLIVLGFKYNFTTYSDASVTTTTHFEAYTSTTHYKFINDGGGWKEEEPASEIAILKIPGIYIRRPKPIWDGIETFRHEIEMNMSRESDSIRKNNKPILVLKGTFGGTDKPTGNETREVYQVNDVNGGIDMIAPAITYEASTSLLDKLENKIAQMTQFPDLSQSKIVGQGIVSAAAMETLLISSHLRIGGEAPEIEKFLSMESGIIKSFLSIMRPEWANYINDLGITHTIVPFSFFEQSTTINNMYTAVTGGLASKYTAIKNIGLVNDVDAEIALIAKEREEEAQFQLNLERSTTTL